MTTVTDLISKIEALATSIGLALRAKLSVTDAANTYAAKESLGFLAYKDTLASNDLTADAVAVLKGAKGDKGDTGTSITNVELNTNGHLIITIG